jgi:site-specific recombinase XerD
VNARLGALLYSFFEDYLKTQKGLRPSSLRSYRDALRLFLGFVAADRHRQITRLALADLTMERVLLFLRHLEEGRGNCVRTRNQRLAALRTFFCYLASRVPEMLDEAQRVAQIPTKRTPPPQTHFLERDAVEALFAALPSAGKHSLRDRALLLFLYNTGARVQEAAELERRNLDLGAQPRVHLHGKGDKWRLCPLWQETAAVLARLLEEQGAAAAAQDPVFCSGQGRPLTRFGIYKVVRRHTAHLTNAGADPRPRPVSPHILRHTTAVHLLESGVEVNVIRAWLGHVSLDTTNRYAEVNMRAKEAALRACEPPPSSSSSEGFPRKAVWRDDENLLRWLDSL